MSQITRHVIFRPGHVLCNGRAWPERSTMWPRNAVQLVRELYGALDMRYRKLFKMDLLSQLGLLGAEMLWQEGNPAPNPDKIGMSLANASSSLHTDRQFYRTIAEGTDFHPSPALFVYTLPNIVIGEICIRHGFTGEHIFQILERFRADRICYFADELLAQGRAEACICGWVEPGPPFDVFLYLVEKEGQLKRNTETWPHQPETVQALYQNV